MTSEDVAQLFIRATTARFRDEYLPRIERALAGFPDASLWWRPHENTTCIGNLLLHLAGNVRQWICSGVGGASDGRDRAAEFAARDGSDGATLLAALRATVEEACEVIDALDAAALLERRRIQGFDTTVLEAVYHVLEHFGWHAGQITWIAKERLGEQHGIAFYDESAVNSARNE